MKNQDANSTLVMKKSFAQRSWFWLTAILLFAGCTLLLQCTSETTENDRQIVDPPFENIQINASSDQFNSKEGGVFKKETGTTISVPEDAFITQEGQPYDGEVILNFDEYHSPAEIIASGIPMYYEGEDGSGTFTSAGMFTITFSTPDHRSLNLRKGKDVGVSLASNVSDPNYNFYVLDPISEALNPAQSASILQIQALGMASTNPIAGRWRMLSKAPAPGENPELLETNRALETLPEEPVKPESMLDDAYKFEIDANLKNYPELEGFKGIIWQYDGGADAASDPNQNEWINSHPWNDIKITRDRGGKFHIELFSDKKKFKTPVKPVFSKVDMKNAEVAYKTVMSNYESTRKKKVGLFKRKKMLKQFARALSVSAPGTYNCDVLSRVEASNVELNSAFNFDGINEKPKSIYVVSKLDGEGRYVAMKQDKQNKSFVVSSMCKSILLAIFPSGKVATCDQNSIDQAIKSKKEGAADYNFNFQLSDQTITDTKQLDQIIHSMI